MFGVNPYHSGLNPDTTPFAFVTDGEIAEATLQEVNKGRITAERTIHKLGKLAAC